MDGPGVEYRSGIDFIDIAMIYGNTKLAIEIDEEYHDEPERKKKDAEKNKRLIAKGWRVLRVSHKLFHHGPEVIAEAIIKRFLNYKQQDLQNGNLF